MYCSQLLASNQEQNQPELFNFSNNHIPASRVAAAASSFTKALIDIRTVSFNPQAFQSIEGRDSIDIKNGTLVGQSVTFSPPNLRMPLTLVVNKVSKPFKENNIVTYTGKVEGDFYSSFTFSVDEEVIVGRVKHKGLIYYIEPNQELSGALTLMVLDEQKIPKNPDDVVESKPTSEKSSAGSITNKSSGSNGHVKVLFLYASDVYGAASKAANFVTDFNTIKAQSLVSNNNIISSAGVEMVADNFSGLCKTPILDAMEDRTGVFSDIDNRMIATGADVVMLLVRGSVSLSGCYPGYTGRVGGKALFFNSTNPFLVVADNYLGSSADLTGVHELGHVFDGRHPSSPLRFKRGIINTSDPSKYWQSIMGSYDSPPCNFNGPIDSVCERVPYFSNPDLTFNGDPLGSLVLHEESDMESHLEYAMPIVSNWRGAPVPPPSTPTGFTAEDDDCYGFYDVSWNAVGNATSYQLYKSVNPSFTSPSLIYSGTSLNSYINVPSGSWYLRVKACNAGGCSSYSPQKTATRLAYCM